MIYKVFTGFVLRVSIKSLVLLAVVSLNAASLTIPPTALGRSVMPQEKPLWNWQVYKKSIVINKSDFKNFRPDFSRPETAALGFFLNLENRSLFYSVNIKENVKRAIDAKVSSELKNDKIYRIRLLASITRKKIESLKVANGFIERPKTFKKILGLFGDFDNVIFIETPAYPNDNFVFIKKENNQFKIVGILGWPFNP